MTPGVTDADLDAGLTGPPAVLGDRVWFDADGDGVQDPGELGLADVTARLYKGGNPVATTATDRFGRYEFSTRGRTPGSNYRVQLTVPAGFILAPEHAAGVGAYPDSDFDATGSTATFAVSGGRTDWTIDAGLTAAPQAPPPAPPPPGSPPPAPPPLPTGPLTIDFFATDTGSSAVDRITSDTSLSLWGGPRPWPW